MKAGNPRPWSGVYMTPLQRLHHRSPASLVCAVRQRDSSCPPEIHPPPLYDELRAILGLSRRRGSRTHPHIEDSGISTASLPPALRSVWGASIVTLVADPKVRENPKTDRLLRGGRGELVGGAQMGFLLFPHRLLYKRAARIFNRGTLFGLSPGSCAARRIEFCLFPQSAPH